MRRLMILAVIPLAGCGRVDTLLSMLDDLVSPTVAAGMYVGVDLPPGVDFGFGEDFSVSAAEFYLAHFEDLSEIDSAPVMGAEAQFDSDDNKKLVFGEEGDGKYRLTSIDGLVYTPGDEAKITFDEDFGAGELGVIAPPAPDSSVPSSVMLNKAVIADAGAAYDNILVAVYDIERNELVYDNLPQTFDDIYAYTHPEEQIEQVQIPGEAFDETGLYVVGVAGMELAHPDDFTGVNVSLSAFMAGQFDVNLLSVATK